MPIAQDVHPGFAQRVKTVPALKDVIALKRELYGDMTLATLLGQAIPDAGGQVELHNLDSSESFYYNPTSTATTANAEIKAGTVFTIDGSKEILDLVHVYATSGSDSAVNVNVIVRSSTLGYLVGTS